MAQRFWWIVFAHMLLFMASGTGAVRVPGAEGANPGAQESPPGGSSLQVSYKFKNGEFLGDSPNGYICVPTDLNWQATAEGKETLTVHVEDTGGNPREGAAVSVHIIDKPEVFYFAGLGPSTVEITKLTDAAGNVRFEFAAARPVGTATLRIKVDEAGFESLASGYSFFLRFGLQDHSREITPLQGTPQLTPLTAAPPSVFDAFTFGGADVKLDAKTDTPGDEEIESAFVEIRVDFDIVTSPFDSPAGPKLKGRKVVVTNYLQFLREAEGPYNLGVTDPDGPFATIGFRLDVTTSGVDGVPENFHYPAEDPFTLDGYSVPFRPSIGRPMRTHLHVRSQLFRVGPFSESSGIVEMRVFEKSTTHFKVFVRAAAAGRRASVKGEFTAQEVLLQGLPQCPF